MDDIVERALENTEENRHDAGPEREFGAPRILAIGCGKGGIEALYEIQTQCDPVETLAITRTESESEQFTYTVSQSRSTAPLSAETIETFIPDDSSTHELADILRRADLCFVIADLSEPRSLPAVATAITAANRSDPMTVGLFTLQRAQKGVQAGETPGDWFHDLLQYPEAVGLIDSTTVADLRDIDARDAHTRSRALYVKFVIELANTLVQPSLINLDYADITTSLHHDGIFTLLVLQSPKGQESKLMTKFESDGLRPLYPTGLTDMSGCWIHITAGPGITLSTAERIAHEVTNILEQKREKHLQSIWSARILDDQGIRLQLVYTGVELERTPKIVFEE